MRILHFHSSLTSGGVEAMIVGLANTMSETEDVSVCLMYRPSDKDIFFKKLKNNIKTFNLGKTRSGFSISIPFKVIWFLLRNKFDAIQLHGFFYYYMIAIFLLHNKVNFFYTVHNDAPLENTKWDKKFLGIKKRFLKWGWMHPVTISDSSQKSFETLYPNCKNEKIFNGIAIPRIDTAAKQLIERYKICPETRVFINPGRICEQKNQVILVKVFKRLIEDNQNIVLLIAGQCQDQKILSELKPYFNNRIKYLGEIDNIPSLLHYCDGMCLPSKYEGLPVVLLETLAVGCPSICSPVGGIKDVITSGYNGILSENSTEESYYQAMTRFLNLSIEDLNLMNENCIKSFSKYEIHNTASQYIGAYKLYLSSNIKQG